MCGRFTQNYTWAQAHDFLSLFGPARNLQPRYNIAPTTMVDVIRLGPQGREIVSMRWGLIPGWWKKAAKDMPATFNARAETVAEKPMFRNAFKERRCIIPASGFYEWTGEKGAKQPHMFTAAASGDQVVSCTIIVSGASAWMEPYHDRMPVLLAEKDFDAWLDGTLGPDALKPAAEAALHEWPVSTRLNRTGVGDDDPTIIEPIAA